MSINSRFKIIAPFFVLYFTITLILTNRSLSYGWFWDDLHLIRTFTNEEIKSAFVGAYDIDGFETLGYRPFYVLFNHTRVLIFGENTAAHRVFILGIIAVFLALFADAAARLGVPYGVSALGGVLALVSRNNWFALVWLTDGNRAWIGLLWVLSVLSLLWYLESRAWWQAALCLMFATIALLTREDSLALFPLVSILALAYMTKFFTRGETNISGDRQNARRRTSLVAIGIISTLLFSILIIFFALRYLFIPRAPIGRNLLGWLMNVIEVLYPMGMPAEDGSGVWVYIAWTIVLIFLIVAVLVARSPEAHKQILFWLTCTMVAAAPGITAQRVDLLFFPILFFSLALATAIIDLARGARWKIITAAAGTTLLVLFLASESMLAQETMHPSSLEYIYLTYDLVKRPTATIPQIRRNQIQADWSQLGINSINEFPDRYILLYDQAKAQNLRRPNTQNLPFIPLIPSRVSSFK